MTTIQTADRNVLEPEGQQPVPCEGPCQCQRAEGGRCHRGRDDEVEHGHPWFEDGLVLAVPENGECQQQALGDQVRNKNGEGDPRKIVEHLGQFRCAFRAEGAEEPEHIGDEKYCGRPTGAGDQAVGQDRRAMSHPPDLHRQQDHGGDQTDAEPVEQDHAVPDARGLVAIEACDLLCRHRRRHRMKEAGKQEERGDPDDRHHGQCPEQDQLAVTFVSSSNPSRAKASVADRQLAR